MNELSKYNSITERDYNAVAGPDWPSYSDFQQRNNVPEFVYKEIGEMLPGSVTFENPAFCVLPFYSWEIPINSPCCLLPRRADVESIRSQMLAGQRPRACDKCWRLEDSGLLSDRQIKNQTLDYYFDQDLNSIFNECVKGNNQVRHYKIDTSNVCNATCATCNSKNSSAWAQLERKNQMPTTRTWRISNEQVHSQVNYSTAKSIIFRGGEPFLSATNFYILEQLLEHNNPDCFISFVTNGSIELSNYQQTLLSNFNNVNFCFSIDGIGPVFEYLRYPLKWSVLEQNIQYCRDNHHGISVNYTLSNLNVYYHNQTTQWFDSNQIPYIVNPVYDPPHFQPTALPEFAKKYITDQMIDPQARNLLRDHTEKDDQNYQQFLKEIARQHQWKGIATRDYLPELADLLEI